MNANENPPGPGENWSCMMITDATAEPPPPAFPPKARAIPMSPRSFVVDAGAPPKQAPLLKMIGCWVSVREDWLAPMRIWAPRMCACRIDPAAAVAAHAVTKSFPMSVLTLKPTMWADNASAQSALFEPPRQSGLPNVMVDTLTNVEKTLRELSAQLNTRHWLVVFTQAMYMTSFAPWPGTRMRCPPALVKFMFAPPAVTQSVIWSMLRRAMKAPSQNLDVPTVRILLALTYRLSLDSPR